jgi:integrase
MSTGKPFLSLEELTALLQYLPNIKRPDRVIVMLAALCALRPGEVFGLTWQCYSEDGLYIRQRIYRGEIDTPKSEASQATVPVPKIVRKALDRWRGECGDSSEEAFVFATKVGTPLNLYNFLGRVLGPIGKKVGIHAPVNFQMLRRTWATHAGSFGADLKSVETVLRHSASLNFSVGTYQQSIRENVLKVMDKFAEAVAATLVDMAPPTQEERKAERGMKRLMYSLPPEKYGD